MTTALIVIFGALLVSAGLLVLFLRAARRGMRGTAEPSSAGGLWPVSDTLNTDMPDGHRPTHEIHHHSGHTHHHHDSSSSGGDSGSSGGGDSGGGDSGGGSGGGDS